MKEGVPKFPIKKEEPNLSRRKFLIGGAALAGTAIAGSYYLYGKNGSEDESLAENELTFPSEEKMYELRLAQEKIRTCVANIQERPFMEKPHEAKKKLENVEVNHNHTSVAIGLEEGGVMKTMHIQNVQELSNQVRNGKGAGVYVHHEGNTRYHISLEDTVVDVGVSNRFRVQRHFGNGALGEPLPVYAVKRSRYEKKQVIHKVPGKKGKMKEVKETTGDYVGYVIYTPPAEHLVRKEVVESGKEYVETVLDAAYEVLSHRMTKSNKKVLKICHDICKRLAVIEHVDPIALVKAEKKVGNESDAHVEARRKSFFRKMYAEYGLNQDISFNHLINALGAGGMMQIVKKTYGDVRERLIIRKIFLPDEIPENADEGRKNPLFSAIIAMYLCYDNFLVKGKILSTMNDDEIELSLVSMYNGSPNLFGKILKGEAKKPSAHKNQNKKALPEKSPHVPYPKATPFIQRLLTHNEGTKLPGSGQSENGNYLRKYVWLKMNEKKL